MSARLLAGLILAALLALPSAASAATKNGITPTSPKAGATVPVGKRPTLKGRVKGPGVMFVRVCKNRSRNADGVLCDDASVRRDDLVSAKQAKRSGGKFSVKMPFFDFPAFWLNSPGTYYWQAHRIHSTACKGSDCSAEGPIVKIKVG